MTGIFRELKLGLSLQLAAIVIGGWAISLWNCLQIEVGSLSPISAICLVAGQTWLYTGLFITAHDAMHGSIHSSLRLNYAIGQLCLWLYAGFDYTRLRVKHRLHHQYPASDRDPDFHDGKTHHFWGWYGQFVREHLSWRQLLNLVVIFGIYVEICQFPILNLGLFWILPALLSSIQLFYFGTFLPHREPIDGYIEPHRAYTITRSPWWSLITCYHFGYHQEHHESPHIPWWQLYLVDRRSSIADENISRISEELTLFTSLREFRGIVDLVVNRYGQKIHLHPRKKTSANCQKM